ncbi:phospholipase A2, minor isoenzyme-like [Triplophysa rosa]|uniref:phospholipase A2, minor isoenzyme-like n=1 Tax=Triplophysa rosa TaxID=992332 RepID=UPI00254621F7|nr:phospholipase A2, minor isoenzyme-like [Triplophysa rosa]
MHEAFLSHCLNQRGPEILWIKFMDVYLTVLILSATLPLSHLNNEKQLLQFREMIKCTLPNSSPLQDFGDYGCFCGLGGQGTPVDQLDQCCFTHDHCYGNASNYDSCDSFLDNPYTNIYDFKCNKNTKTITCLASNNACEMFICQCDKTAAECFAQAPYNTSNNQLSNSLCSSASRENLSFINILTILTLLYSKIQSH